MSGGRSIASLDSTVVRVRHGGRGRGLRRDLPAREHLPGRPRGRRPGGAARARPGGGRRRPGRVPRARRPHGRGPDGPRVRQERDRRRLLGCGREAQGVSVTTLLGGVRNESFPLYVAIPLGDPAAMADHVAALRAEGITRFQLKVGDSPRVDAERVAGGASPVRAGRRRDRRCERALHDAGGRRGRRPAGGARPVYVEQPCPTLEACRYVRERSALPFVLDECISDVPSLVRAHDARAMEAFNLKISKVGGLTKARQMRDLADALGLSVTIEDTWGGDLVTAAVSHLAAEHEGTYALHGVVHERLDKRARGGVRTPLFGWARVGAGRPRAGGRRGSGQVGGATLEHCGMT